MTGDAASGMADAAGGLTYVLALLASCANAVASVAQRTANRNLPGEVLRLRLIVHLMRQPIWYVGIGALILGFILQAVALTMGALSVVQPILVCELPLTLLLASLVLRSGLHTREWASIIGMTLGLAALLYALAPTSGSPLTVRWYVWVIASGANLALIGTAVAFGRPAPPAWLGWASRLARAARLVTPGRNGARDSGRRAASLGVAAGCQFGLTAALMKGAMSRSGQGIGAVLSAWQLYALLASGLMGAFLLQSAMNAGRLLAAQPGLTLSNPLVAVLWGIFVFHEAIRRGLFLIVALVAAVVIAASVLILARSPLLSGPNTTNSSGHDRPPP